MDHPSGGGVVRNMMPTRDGNLAIAESGVNRVALVSIGRDGTSSVPKIDPWGLVLGVRLWAMTASDPHRPGPIRLS